MRMSRKSHGRKTDQETQSPMLKIFKDIMQRDKDPEKTNLLKDNHEERKKRHYTSSKPKAAHKNETSSSDRSRKTVSYKSQETRNLEYDQCRPRSTPFQGDRKESWWFWGEKNSNRDTRSCVSCALKKLGGSEYFCVGCLLLIFAVSVGVAFLLVFRSVPTIAADITPATATRMLDSDRLRRKMDALNEKKEKFKLKVDSREKREWDNTVWKNVDGQSPLTRTDFGRSGLNDMVSIEGNEKPDSLNILDAEKFEEIHTNDKLRDFFKKLAQTDAQIRLLKKGLQDPGISTYESEKTLNQLLDRSKRSIKFNRTKLSHFGKFDNSKGKSGLKSYIRRPFYVLKRDKNNTARNKRFFNDTVPSGFYIEKKEMLVQYVPVFETRKIPKCSHSAKESKSHEKLLKHPFYKNTQRLDEFLDQFTAKNFNEITENPYALDLLMKKKKEKCKHPHTNKDSSQNNKPNKNPSKHDHKTAKPKNKSQPAPKMKLNEQKISDEEIRKLLQPLDTSKELEKGAKKLQTATPKEKIIPKAHTKEYDVILSIATVLTPEINMVTTPMPFERNYIFRKLMQLEEEDDESIGYEDLNEVLAEDLEAHDEKDSHGDRKKREDENKFPQTPNVPNPPGVNNPNWKGAMPLYPDEVNSMIKQAAINANKLVFFKNKIDKDVLSAKDTSEAEEGNDVQYIEEYFNSKYKGLVHMAQAYSDYGVLDGKRNGVGTEKSGSDKILEHRVKLSADGPLLGDKLFGRLKKGMPSEGIRFELRPTASSREDTSLGMSKLLHKHVQISEGHSTPASAHHGTTTSMLPINPEIDFMFSPTKYDKHVEDTAKSREYKYDNDHGIAFSITKNRRTLKSFDDSEDSIESYSDALNDVEISDEENGIDVINEGVTGVLFDNLKVNNSSRHNFDVKGLNVIENKKITAGNDKINIEKSVEGSENTNSNITFILIDHNKDNSTEQGSNRNTIHAYNTLNLEPTLINGAKENESEEYNRNVFNTTTLAENSTNDLFMMLSNFFSFLDYLDLVLKPNESLNPYGISRRTDKANISFANVSDYHPTPGSPMITNLGYRSRLLLSVNDSMKIDTVQDEATATEQRNEITDTAKIDEIINSTIIKVGANHTKLDADGNKIHVASNNIKSPKNKTLVKRNAEDSNLIFWNDIYDDEYGVKIEPEDTVRDKHSVPRSSSAWFKDKLRKLTNNLRKQPDKDIEKIRISRDISESRKSVNGNEDSSRRLNKRDLKLLENDDFPPDQGFATLNANMKEICRKAARAVQQTKNLEVKENAKESTAATSLMQQLVKLMTDLVDYQVQQKTCVQLPPDLQSFLEWLTEPDQDNSPDMSNKSGFQEDSFTDLDTDISEEKPTERYLGMEMITPTTSEREEVRPEERSDCLGTLRAVQDLILQFNELSEEDKSKMAGIKEYLDNQLDYLEKYIVSVDDINVNQKRDFPLRFKRHAFGRKMNNEKRNKTNKESNIRRRMKNILKFNKKKHGKTTKGSFTQTTEVSRQETRKKETKGHVNIFDTDMEQGMEQNKRNLKDVYFKAVAEAKKSTVKNLDKY